MSKLIHVLATVAIMLTSTLTIAQNTLGDLSFQDPWIRGSVPGQKNGAGYLVIQNKATIPAALQSANSDRADRIELHTIVREDGVAKMREVKQIDVPSQGSVTLQPGGYHIMFIGLKQPFKEGESIPVKLNFASGQSATVSFTVKAPTFIGGTGMQGHGKMSH